MRYLAIMAALVLLFLSCASAEGEFPELNSEGFLDEGEFVYENAEEGVWRYAGTGLRVEIYRRSDTRPNLIWYEAEIWSAEGESFRMLCHDEDKRMTSLQYPYQIARERGAVFALNSDFAHLRISQKQRPGILLRDGEIISDRTRKKNNRFPNLDTLALFEDGDMRVAYSNELKASDYAELGARDVLSFGPYLIRDGELNTTALKKYGTGRAPRTAIGMVEKGHYFALMAEGRHKGSKGVSIRWMAEKLQELGCTLGFNLDGGQSAAIVFRGRQLNTLLNAHGYRASARKAAEILAIGSSELAARPEDGF